MSETRTVRISWAVVAEWGRVSWDEARAFLRCCDLDAGPDGRGERRACRIARPGAHESPQPRALFKWDQNRWSLKLDMSQPVGHDMEIRDMQAGAYFHVTPSLNVGGAVSNPDAPAQPGRTDLPQDQAPRVKLETSFKF